jgi:hypothetical protein
MLTYKRHVMYQRKGIVQLAREDMALRTPNPALGDNTSYSSSSDILPGQSFKTSSEKEKREVRRREAGFNGGALGKVRRCCQRRVPGGDRVPSRSFTVRRVLDTKGYDRSRAARYSKEKETKLDILCTATIYSLAPHITPTTLLYTLSVSQFRSLSVNLLSLPFASRPQ